MHYAGRWFSLWGASLILILNLGGQRPNMVDPLAAGYWLLATGCWLLVTGCWLLVTSCWLLAAGYRGLEAVIRTIGCWLLAVLDHWLWTGGELQ